MNKKEHDLNFIKDLIEQENLLEFFYSGDSDTFCDVANQMHIAEMGQLGLKPYEKYSEKWKKAVKKLNQEEIQRRVDQISGNANFHRAILRKTIVFLAEEYRKEFGENLWKDIFLPDENIKDDEFYNPYKS